jgi:hypothetical protein
MMNIPALVMTPVKLNQLQNGMEAIVDGFTGEFLVEPAEEEIAKADEKINAELEKRRMLEALKGLPTETKSGQHVKLYANIGSVEDVEYVLDNDAEGIGLFRSEFLYLGRCDLPTEEEQYEAYKKVLTAMEDRRVIIRTLDIGADKQADYLNLDKEENPALGYRAIRICLTQKEIFKTQLRALLRAAVYGNLAVMYPMIRPMTMELIRRYRLLLLLKKMMLTNTKVAKPMCSKLPNDPFALAASPPPQAVMPTLMRLIPMSVTTIPETNGVMILRVYFNTRLMSISTDEATMVAPNMAESPPVRPAEMIGPMNEKLVPCTQSRPQPMPPTRLHWMKVAIPDTIRDMETR